MTILANLVVAGAMLLCAGWWLYERRYAGQDLPPAWLGLVIVGGAILFASSALCLALWVLADL